MKDTVSRVEPFTGSRSRPFEVTATKAVAEFKHYCKCKHCGHEWTETKVVKFNA